MTDPLSFAHPGKKYAVRATPHSDVSNVGAAIEKPPKGQSDFIALRPMRPQWSVAQNSHRARAPRRGSPGDWGAQFTMHVHIKMIIIITAARMTR